MQSPRLSRRGTGGGEAITINTSLPSQSSNAEWRPPVPPKGRNSNRHSRLQSVDGDSRTSRLQSLDNSDTWRTSHYIESSPPRVVEEEIGPDTWRTSHEISRPNSTVSAVSNIDIPPLRSSLPASRNLRSDLQIDPLRTTPPSPLSRNSNPNGGQMRMTPPSPLSRISLRDRESEYFHHGITIPPTPPPRNSRRGEEYIQPLTPVTPLRTSPPRRNSRPDIHNHDPSRPPHSRHNSENLRHQGHIRRHSRNLSSSHIPHISEEYGLLQSPQAQESMSSPREKWRYEYPKREKRKVPKWAGIPQSLALDRGERWRRWAWDILGVGATVPFWVVLGCVIEMDGKVVKHEEERRLRDLLSVVRFLPLTIFLPFTSLPILTS
jgi:hypothetical protein